MPSLPAHASPAVTHAYPSPWYLDRSLASPWFELENRGFEAAHAVTITLLGSARLLTAVPGRVDPGRRVRFAVRGDDPAVDSTLIVRWLRPDGEEYLSREVF